MSRCSWCGLDAEEAAERHEGPHLTWCPHFREEQRGGYSMSRNVNIYQDPYTAGWICEVKPYPQDPDCKWHRIGVFGSRAAAVAAVPANR